jgi:tryptophan-rich sensory protein
LGDVIRLGISVAACFAAGGLGSVSTFKAIPTWYATLRKPPKTPPNRAFGPVWTTLYVLMGVSVFLVWRGGLASDVARIAFALFWVQLALNALWSYVFFGMKSIGGGVITIVILWFLILATTVASFRVSILAGSLLTPYLVWVTIASYLNIGVWWLNKPARQRKGA